MSAISIPAANPIMLGLCYFGACDFVTVGNYQIAIIAIFVMNYIAIRRSRRRKVDLEPLIFFWSIDAREQS